MPSLFDGFLYKHSNLLVVVHFTPFFYYLVAIYHHLFSRFCKNLQTHLLASRLLSNLCSLCTRKSISELASNPRFPYLKSFNGALLPSRESQNPTPHLVYKCLWNDLCEARAVSTISICLCLSPLPTTCSLRELFSGLLTLPCHPSLSSSLLLPTFELFHVLFLVHTTISSFTFSLPALHMTLLLLCSSK